MGAVYVIRHVTVADSRGGGGAPGARPLKFSKYKVKSSSSWQRKCTNFES